MHFLPRRFLPLALVLTLLIAAVASSQPVTTSLPAPHGALRLAVVGDTGLETTTIAKRLAGAGPIDAILLVGDNFYPCGVKSAKDPKWRVIDPLTRLGVPIYAVLGNHDHCGSADAQVNASVPNWHMPARSYAIRSDVADFAMIDTTPYALGSSRRAEEDVKEILSGSKAPWRIAVGHHVIVSSGFHGLYPRHEARNMGRLLPVLREARADLYICGHDHHEEVIGGQPMFLVSGAGSDPVPMIRVRGATLWPRRLHIREPIGFAIVEITPATLRMAIHGTSGKRISPWFSVPRP